MKNKFEKKKKKQKKKKRKNVQTLKYFTFLKNYSELRFF